MSEQTRQRCAAADSRSDSFKRHRQSIQCWFAQSFRRRWVRRGEPGYSPLRVATIGLPVIQSILSSCQYSSSEPTREGAPMSPPNPSTHSGGRVSEAAYPPAKDPFGGLSRNSSVVARAVLPALTPCFKALGPDIRRETKKNPSPRITASPVTPYLIRGPVSGSILPSIDSCNAPTPAVSSQRFDSRQRESYPLRANGEPRLRSRQAARALLACMSARFQQACAGSLR